MIRILQRLLPWAMLALCMPLFVIQSISLHGVVGSDTVTFHEAVQRALADPALLYVDADGVIETARSLQGFLYPPPSIALLLPFGVGTPAQGHALLSWSALIAAIGSILAWLVMAQRLGLVATSRIERAALIAIASVTGAVFACRLGQVDTLIVGLVTLGIWLAWQNRPDWGGAVLAFGSCIKIYPALLMLPLLADRRKRAPAFIGYTAAALMVFVATLLAFPLAAWRDFFTMLPIMAERTIVNIDNQSIAAVWARSAISAEQALTSYDAIIVPAWLRGGVSIAAVATIAAFMWRRSLTAAPSLWVAAVATAIISLIAPLGWGHSFAYVLPLMILCLAVAWRARAWWACAAGGLIWAALVIPSHRQFPMLPADSLIWHIAYARYTVAACCLLALSWGLMGKSAPEAEQT